jgi:hypothetical protein
LVSPIFFRTFATEDTARVLYAKDKLVSEVDDIERDYLTPKEYGIKKLGKRR